MKKILLIISMVLALVPALLAQSNPEIVKWTLLDSKDNVKVYRAYIMCSNQLRVAIKVENTGANKVQVTWNSGFMVSGNMVAINLPFTVDAEANETLTGDCQYPTLLFDPYLYVSTVQEGVCDYTIQNLNIVIL